MEAMMYGAWARVGRLERRTSGPPYLRLSAATDTERQSRSDDKMFGGICYHVTPTSWLYFLLLSKHAANKDL
jgi:hypothetical protein